MLSEVGDDAHAHGTEIWLVNVSDRLHGVLQRAQLHAIAPQHEYPDVAAAWAAYQARMERE